VDKKKKGCPVIMKFTEEQLDLILPRQSASMSEDEYLDMLTFDNDGVDFGSVLNCDPAEVMRAEALIQQWMASKTKD